MSLGPAWLGFQLRYKVGQRGPNRFGAAPAPPAPNRPDVEVIPVERRDLDAELRETRQALDKAEADLRR